MKNIRIKRCIAWFIDWLLCCLPCLLYTILFAPSLVRPSFSNLLGLFLLVPATFILFVLRDVIFGGRSVGKRIFGLHVIDLRSSAAATNDKKILRNLFFFLYLVDVFVLLATGQTIGDRIAGTLVVMEIE